MSLIISIGIVFFGSGIKTKFYLIVRFFKKKPIETSLIEFYKAYK